LLKYVRKLQDLAPQDVLFENLPLIQKFFTYNKNIMLNNGTYVEKDAYKANGLAGFQIMPRSANMSCCLLRGCAAFSHMI
jgi:hypothetical protein